MRWMLSICLSVFLGLSFGNAASAGIVTDSFLGTDTLLTPGNLGDHSSNVYTYTVTTSNSCATLSFNINLTVSGGPVHFDNRGFGDSSGPSDALQRQDGTMSIAISNMQVTALPGFTYISDTLDVGITSFDLVNNGRNSPQILWSDNLGGAASYNSSGTTRGHTETVNITAGATQLDITANRHWMWINNIALEYSGQVSVFHTLPEPSSALMFLLALAPLLSRRRTSRSHSPTLADL